MMPAMEIRLGYKASAEQFDPRQLLDYGVAAERAGFNSVVVSDHFQPWRHTGGHAPFSFAWLAALGERTERVMLGTSVVTPTFRYNPAIVAQAMATIACLNPQRVMLGVGSGESMNEVPAIGVEWPEPPERFARLKEAIELIRRLWTEEFVTFEGTYFRTHNATIYDKPAEPVALYVAASGPAAARLAGRTADGFICTSGKGEELYRDTLLPALREGADKAGRDYDAIDKLIEMKVSFNPDRSQALADCRPWAALSLPGEVKRDVEDPREMERLADELSDEEAASRWIVSDDADEHVEQIADYVEMGFNHLVFHLPADDQLRSIELYGEQILPKLRARFA
jgi:coenzyme F420-dependent glucose-6-phosphate dehydrogenase